jgi:hypothetical protein
LIKWNELTREELREKLKYAEETNNTTMLAMATMELYHRGLIDTKGNTLNPPDYVDPEKTEDPEPAQQEPVPIIMIPQALPKEPEPPPTECKYCGKLTIKPGDIICSYCGGLVQPDKPIEKRTFTAQIHQIHTLDAIAGAIVFVIWLSLSYWYIKSFAFNWLFLVGFAGLWLVFVVVFRVVTGGILD